MSRGSPAWDGGFTSPLPLPNQPYDYCIEVAACPVKPLMHASDNDTNPDVAEAAVDAMKGSTPTAATAAAAATIGTTEKGEHGGVKGDLAPAGAASGGDGVEDDVIRRERDQVPKQEEQGTAIREAPKSPFSSAPPPVQESNFGGTSPHSAPAKPPMSQATRRASLPISRKDSTAAAEAAIMAEQRAVAALNAEWTAADLTRRRSSMLPRGGSAGELMGRASVGLGYESLGTATATGAPPATAEETVPLLRAGEGGSARPVTAADAGGGGGGAPTGGSGAGDHLPVNSKQEQEGKQQQEQQVPIEVFQNLTFADAAAASPDLTEMGSTMAPMNPHGVDIAPDLFGNSQWSNEQLLMFAVTPPPHEVMMQLFQAGIKDATSWAEGVPGLMEVIKQQQV
jgi:hypothetical protein